MWPCDAKHKLMLETNLIEVHALKHKAEQQRSHMKILNADEVNAVVGAEILATIGTVGVATALIGLTFWLEYYAIQEAQAAYDAIDFNALTPKAAYELGYTEGLISCRHFYY